MKNIEIFAYYYDINSNYHQFKLDDDISDIELSNYFNYILSYNNINKKNMDEELDNNISFILPGFLRFNEDNIVFDTGCCFEINDIKRTLQNFSSFNIAWLGHDPEPYIKYNDKIITIFSDKDLDCEYINFNKEEFIQLVNKADNDLNNFIEIKFYNYLKANYKTVADIIYNKFKNYYL